VSASPDEEEIDDRRLVTSMYISRRGETTTVAIAGDGSGGDAVTDVVQCQHCVAVKRTHGSQLRLSGCSDAQCRAEMFDY